MDSRNIHAIGCDLSDARIQHVLNEITRLKSLARPVVCLPDLHIKDRTEAPSSFAAATRDTIVPDLTAPSVGCGMGILTTSLTKKDLDHQAFEQFYYFMRRDLGPRYGHLKNILLWLGLIERPKNTYDLSVKEFEDLIKRGAPMAVEKYNLPPQTLNHIENHGSVFTHDELDSLNLSDILPRISYRSGRHDLGYGFKGNHFLEIQYIEDILDEEAAQKWNLKKDQVVIMYHGGGGAVSYHIGRYFANRKKNTLKQKFALFILKALFHFGAPTKWKYATQRFRYYFFPRPFTEIPLSSPEGQRLLRATKASLNYSYGFRMAITKRITDSLRALYPKKDIETALLWDSSHNTVTREIIGGEELTVHRHTANRVFEGQPVIISGFNTTNSYLAIGQAQSENHLFSADHGAGTVIKRLKTHEHPERLVTHIYQTKSPFKQIVTHQTNEGIDHVTKELTSASIIRPVIRLRPLAVFKG
ncbi:MAG: RtcB family protein [Patescibacteria group bacterium]